MDNDIAQDYLGRQLQIWLHSPRSSHTLIGSLPTFRLPRPSSVRYFVSLSEFETEHPDRAPVVPEIFSGSLCANCGIGRVRTGFAGLRLWLSHPILDPPSHGRAG